MSFNILSVLKNPSLIGAPIHLLGISRYINGYKFCPPLSYTISLTHRCNSVCRHCNIWMNPPLTSELDPAHLLAATDSVGDHLKWLTLSGGEPLLYPHLEEVISHIIKTNKTEVITLPTNGLVEGSSDIILSLAKAHPSTTIRVNISLDGTQPVNDKVRSPGSFRKAEALAQALLSKRPSNLEVGFYTVLSKLNYQDLPNLLSHLNTYTNINYAVEPAQYRPIEMYHRDPSEFELTPEIRQVIKQNLKALSRYSSKIRQTYYEHLINLKPYACYSGFGSCHISPVGDVWACCTAPPKYAVLGNLHDYNYNLSALLEDNRPKIDALHRHCTTPCYMSNAFIISQYLEKAHNISAGIEGYFRRLSSDDDQAQNTTA